MNLRHLEMFRFVMQTGSLKGAAALLHISPPAASKMLSAAERQAGILLFERVKGRLVATPAAHRLYEEVDQLWNRVERIRDLTHELSTPTAGSLHLAISPSLGASIIPHTATALIARVPLASVTVDQQIPHLLLRSMVDGVSDLGVSLSPQAHPNLEVLKHYPCDLMCVMPPSHPLAALSVVRAEDLIGHHVVSFPQALAYGIDPKDLYGSSIDRIRMNLDVRSGPTACWFAMAGAGVAIVDSASVAINAFPALAVRPYACAARLGIHLIQHRHRPLSRVGDMFCEELDATLTTFAKQLSHGVRTTGNS